MRVPDVAGLGRVIAVAGVFAMAVAAQQAQPPPAAQAAQQPTPEALLRPTYMLGANDQIFIRATGIEDFGTTPYRIEETGEIALPLVGRLKAAGLTVEQLEQELTKRLKEFVVNPQVSITIVQFRSEPVFVVGAFQKPGIHPLQGRRTLLETLIALGGLQPTASRRIKVTRRLEQGKIPLPNAVENQADGVSTVEINLNKLMETVNPAEDMLLQPYDVISAQKTDVVYVSGEVARPGTFEVIDGESASVIQLVTLAGGLKDGANAKETKVLRPVLGTRKRGEIPVNLQAVLAGRENDFPLLPNDVLLVPKTKSLGGAFVRTLAVTLPALATALVVAFVR